MSVNHRALCIVFCLCLAGLLQAQEPEQTPSASAPQTIIFAVNSPGSQPYAYFAHQQQQYVGLVHDLFNTMEKQGLLKARFVDSNRTRSEQFVLEGKMDMFLASSTWLEHPQKMIESIPLLPHSTYLYSEQAFSDNFSPMELNKHHICTRRGFVYPGLGALFAAGQLQRVDSTSDDTVVAMLLKQRCDFAIMNDYVASTTFEKQPFCQAVVYKSPQPTSVDHLTFIMRPQLQPVKQLIDSALQQFIDSGQLAESLKRHSPTVTFPKVADCHARQGH